MTDDTPSQPLNKAEILLFLAAGSHIQRDRHGAAVIHIHGRCADDWEELRQLGWLNKTTSGTYVLSERGRKHAESGEV